MLCKHSLEGSCSKEERVNVKQVANLMHISFFLKHVGQL